MLLLFLPHLLFIIQYLVTNECHATKTLTLDLVQVIFRHGMRTPQKQEAKFMNITDPSIYGFGFGELTREGMMQEYALGQLLRKNYDAHVGNYEENKIVAKSTISARTRMSLELVLAGLFPPTPKEKWHPQLNWRPIPYAIANVEGDVILSPHQSPEFRKLYKKTMANSNEYCAIISKYTNFIKYLEIHTRRPFFDNVLYQCGWTDLLLRIHKIMNLPLPKWSNEKVDEIFATLTPFLYDTLSFTNELKKFNGGTLIRRVVENIELNKNDATRKKIYLYSTHDLTLHAFMKAQNVSGTFVLPPFGSAYIVESYRDSELRYYIRMLSWDGSSDQFVELEVLECGKYCPLDKYINFVRDVIPTDEELKFFESRSSASFEISRNEILMLFTVLALSFFVF